MLHLYLAINYIKERLLAVSGASTEILEDLSKYMKNHLAVVLCASTEVLEDLRNMKNHLAVVLCASTQTPQLRTNFTRNHRLLVTRQLISQLHVELHQRLSFQVRSHEHTLLR